MTPKNSEIDRLENVAVCPSGIWLKGNRDWSADALWGGLRNGRATVALTVGLWQAIAVAAWSPLSCTSSSPPFSSSPAAGRGARAAAAFVPDCVVLFKRLLSDPRVPRRKKLVLAALIPYLLMPFDLVPDFIPVAGYLDDADSVSPGSASRVPHEPAVRRSRSEAVRDLSRHPRSRLTGAAVAPTGAHVSSAPRRRRFVPP
jgi:hypothetical protein